MRNPLHPIALATLLLGTSALTTACLGDEAEEPTLSNESAITNATLGNLKRSIATRSRDGQRDSSYTVLVNGAYYPLTIDQKQGRIYNVDSLPYGTDVSRVAMEKMTQVGGLVIRSLHSAQDTIFNLKDSTDYTRPRQLTTISMDGKHRRHYTVELRVHQQDPEGTHWQSMSAAQWQELAPKKEAAQHFRSRSFWWKIEEGQLLQSADGQRWTPHSIDAQDAAQLPSENLAWACLPARGNAQWEDLLLYGTRGTESLIWKGTADLSGRYAPQWFYLPTTEENTLPAPALAQAQLVAYDEGFILLGINPKSRQVQLLYSADRGRTWKQHPSLRLPAWQAKSVHQLEAFVDVQQHLWLRVNGMEHWRGHINRLLWQPEQNVFLRSARH